MEYYRRLAREAAFEGRKRDKAAAAESKKQIKRGAQALKAMYKQRERG